MHMSYRECIADFIIVKEKYHIKGYRYDVRIIRQRCLLVDGCKIELYNHIIVYTIGINYVRMEVKNLTRGDMVMKKIVYLMILFTFLFAYPGLDESTAQMRGGKKMEIKSAAFRHGARIPAKYTCDGIDVSPSLVWVNAPAGTKRFALICDDPDAPMGTWVHWVIYDIPSDITKLQEKTPPLKELANGAKQGTNDFGTVGYGGPCPPSGEHHYFFKLYALDGPTGLKPGATKAQLLSAMKDHILGEAQLMGKYKR